MKHIKTYENITVLPKLGDYVICYEKVDHDLHVKFAKFLSKNIGRIVSTNVTSVNGVNYNYLIQYNKIPEILNTYFDEYDKPNSRPMNIDEIIEFSENKEDLKAYMAAKKYNL